MVTRGIIRKVPSGEVTVIDDKRNVDNLYQVEIPTLRTANNITTTSTSAFLSDALLCYQPGNINSYRVGDVVFLSIGEPEDLPIIIGKMFVGEEEATNYSKNNSLEVTQKAILPEDTKIGDISFKDLKCTIKTASNGDGVYATQDEIDTINERLDELGFDSASADSSWISGYSGAFPLPPLWISNPERCYIISGGIEKEGNFARLHLYFEVLPDGEVTSGDNDYSYTLMMPSRFIPSSPRVIKIMGEDYQPITEMVPDDGLLDEQQYDSVNNITAGVRLNVDFYYRLNEEE